MSVQTKTKAILLTAVVLAALLAAIIGIYYLKRIQSVGKIKTVQCEVYWDQAGTTPATLIDWGVLEPGQEASKVLFIRNKSNVKANLTLATEEWNPSAASNFIAVSWDYDGRLLNPEEIIAVTFYLNISQYITQIKEFSFNMVIIASG